MSDTAVTSRTLTLNALSAALDSTSTAGTSVSTGNTAVLTPAGGGNTRQVIITAYAGDTSTITPVAGDEPPSEGAGVAPVTALNLTSGKVYILPLEAGQYVQDDGTVRLLVGGTGPIVFNCFTVPRGS